MHGLLERNHAHDLPIDFEPEHGPAPHHVVVLIHDVPVFDGSHDGGSMHYQRHGYRVSMAYTITATMMATSRKSAASQAALIIGVVWVGSMSCLPFLAAIGYAHDAIATGRTEPHENAEHE
jgi:hypothetical protein